MIDNLQVYVEKLVKVAHENWLTDVQEYDGEALIRANPSSRVVNAQVVESSTGSQGSAGPDVQIQNLRTLQSQQQQQPLLSSHPAISAHHLSSTFTAGSTGPGMYVMPVTLCSACQNVGLSLIMNISLSALFGYYDYTEE